MSAARERRVAELLAMDREERWAVLSCMSETVRRPLRHSWLLWAHEGQLAPAGDWLGWLILAGRGFGKTRAGAEWVRALAEADPEARIALVGASLGEARSVMVEGGSGLIAIAPDDKRPKFEPSKRQLKWPNGALATLYSAGEPESLRGPQHSHARRTVPERRLRQRNNRTGRFPAALRGGSRTGCSAHCPGRRPELADWNGRERRLERQGGPDRDAPVRQLAICPAARRDVPAQSRNGTTGAVQGRLAGCRQASGTFRGDHHRCRSARRDCGDHRQPDDSRNHPRKLTGQTCLGACQMPFATPVGAISCRFMRLAH